MIAARIAILAITGNELRRSGASPSVPFVSEVEVTGGGVSVLVVLVISSSTCAACDSSRPATRRFPTSQDGIGRQRHISEPAHISRSAKRKFSSFLGNH